MATFLLEVGTEELPADFVDEALEQWRSRIPKSLADHSLTPEDVEFFGTPRRLAVLIWGLPERQPDQEEEVKGPPAQAAFKDGKPTKAAVGFAQKQGVAVSDLEIRPTEKGDFVFIRKTIVGQPTADILQTLVPAWITGLEGKRFMRWADGDLRFPRPIRWLVALLDSEVLPIELMNGSQGCKSDRISQGHRVLHPEPVIIPHAEEYVSVLNAAFVQVDRAKRQSLIRQQIEASAAEVGGVAVINPALLQEVTNLVESPSPVIGKFDPEFLELPSEVIITEMESHQRYFPVLKQANSDELLPYFITISNGDPAKAKIIAEGNERVIRARLSDGKFFFEADRAVPLESYLPRLETVTFQADLGSVRAKVDRIGLVADLIADQLKITGSDRAHIQRAAFLCKADLVTQMVGEFPELQGIMGQKYALVGGEPEAVANAIFEHYQPRGANDRLPASLTGQVVGIADRLDTLVCIFGLGMIPSGSSDPFALRRAANAIVNIAWAADLPLNLAQLLDQVIANFERSFASVMKLSVEDLWQQLQDFFLQRIRTLLQEDREIDYDLVNAVLGENDLEYTQRALVDLLDVRDRALFLQSIRNNGTLATIYETVNRASRLAAQGTLATTQLDPTQVIQPKYFEKSSEEAFFKALGQLHNQMQGERDYQRLVEALADIAPTVANFFDGPDSVLVMDPNPDIKQNRLNLLGILRNYARLLADFGAIVKS
ncbi:glycine--tRNA ligase subunit beta [Leptodesmis sichuanensis]|uniref:glycine--tRNA ligase subunit beta n=1 Tax=Leptodesmis sichuanensis TaxID=2906798 RepID=UPI001F33D5D2|nr:glycine--tRNA ligase subunit beta [Leptodesmis sichuanensis]UIE38155.1 glycine--tRNA ligase subunit beta [Leptodesmis sichuanensis A121]